MPSQGTGEPPRRRIGRLLTRPCAKLNKKVKRGDEEGLEYRAAFNLLLQLVFGESLKAWAHVNNWFYLHAGARHVSLLLGCREHDSLQLHCQALRLASRPPR